MSSFLVPAASLKVEESIKKSLFTTRLKNVTTAESAKSYIREINQRFPDANHHCWAYIVGEPKATTLVSCSDDGEPSGTAGRPMLHVLQHSEIGDIVAVCTRYFGGTKLGTGGLARAYAGGVKLALENLQTKIKIEYSKIKFVIDYPLLKDCEHLLTSYQTGELDVEYAERLTLSSNIATNRLADFKKHLTNLCKGNLEWI